MLRAVLSVMLLTMSVVAVGSDRVGALPGDGGDPDHCRGNRTIRSSAMVWPKRLSDPTPAGLTVRSRPFVTDFLVKGFAQLRFSDPCNSIWSRTCVIDGYQAYDGKAERVNNPNSPTINAYSTTLRRNGIASTNRGHNICSTWRSTQQQVSTHQVFADCIEQYKVSCETKTASRLGRDGVAVTGWVSSGRPF